MFMNDSDIEEMEAEIAAEKSAGEYDDGMGGEEPGAEEEPQDVDQSAEDDDEQPAEESLLINSTNTLKSYKRGRK